MCAIKVKTSGQWEKLLEQLISEHIQMNISWCLPEPFFYLRVIKSGAKKNAYLPFNHISKLEFMS